MTHSYGPQRVMRAALARSGFCAGHATEPRASASGGELFDELLPTDSEMLSHSDRVFQDVQGRIMQLVHLVVTSRTKQPRPKCLLITTALSALSDPRACSRRP